MLPEADYAHNVNYDVDGAFAVPLISRRMEKSLLIVVTRPSTTTSQFLNLSQQDRMGGNATLMI